MNEVWADTIRYLMPLFTAFIGAFFGIKSSVVRLENDVKKLGDDMDALKGNLNKSTLDGAREHGVLKERLATIEARISDLPSPWLRKTQ